MILTKDCYRSPHLAHRECTSSGAALLRGQRSVCMLHGINLWPVTVLGQGREEKETMEWGRPLAMQGSEDRKQVLPALVSCQNEAGPLTPSWLQRRNSIRRRTSWQKIRTEAAVILWNLWQGRDTFSCLLTCFAVVNMICADGWLFHVHFQLRA